MPDSSSLLVARAVRIQKDAPRIETEIRVMRKQIADARTYADDSSKKQIDANNLLEMCKRLLAWMQQLDKRLEKAVSEAEDIASNAAKAYARGGNNRGSTPGLDLNSLRATLNRSLASFEKAVEELGPLLSATKALMNDPRRTSGGEVKDVSTVIGIVKIVNTILKIAKLGLDGWKKRTNKLR